MRTKIITLLLVLACCGSINISYAAFVKKDAPAKEATTTAKTDGTATTVTTTTTTATVAKEKHLNLFQKIKAKIYPEIVETDSRPGWPGIVAFVCGIVACVAFLSVTGFLLFSLGAFVFGIIGLGSGYKYHLLAIIGLVIGALALLALL